MASLWNWTPTRIDARSARGILRHDRALAHKCVKELIRADLYRYYSRTDWRMMLYALVRIPGFRYTYILRKTSFHYQVPGVFHTIAFVFYKLLLDHYGYKFGFQIPYTTKIGAGLAIYHHGLLIVNPRAILGDNINLSPGVVIGQQNRGRRAGFPTIGDRVWIGCNAVVVGAVSIGDDALIGPGAYVNFDVPEKAVVIGNPGTIHSYAGSSVYVERIAPASAEQFCN